MASIAADYRSKHADLTPKYQSFAKEDLMPSQSCAQRGFYDDFTSVDWVQDYLKDVCYKEALRKFSGPVGQLRRCADAFQDWLLITIIALFSSLIAFTIDICEELLVDLKRGFCSSNLLYNENRCCSAYECDSWKLWPEVFSRFGAWTSTIDFVFYLCSSLLLAYLAAEITLTTRSSYPSDTRYSSAKHTYSAQGSGVPEVKTVLSGFTIRRFFGSYTLLAKSVALVFSIASGLSLGKEGPYVHLAVCVGNIFLRLFKKFRSNGLEKRVILSASAAAGVTLAFGSPLGGVLFSLEEISYYLPGNQLFKTFFCSIMSHLFLKLMNPYGTGKVVLFEVSYESDWQYLEIVFYIIIGIVGGLFGALFCKFSSFWASSFRSKEFIKAHPVREVILVSSITAAATYANKYTNIAVPELLAKMAAPCYSNNEFTGDSHLCPNKSEFPREVWSLSYALLTKIVLTSITFGMKVPAGIYVPTMVIGALFGRICSMLLQYFSHSHLESFRTVLSAGGTDLDLGIYAMISAAAFMAGVTRMNVTLATIMLELTSSYNYVVPFSLAIAVSLFVANAVEPKSLYEMVIQKNELPYLNNRRAHDFSGSEPKLSEIFTRAGPESSLNAWCINLVNSNFASLRQIQTAVQHTKRAESVMDSIPVLKNGKLKAILSLPELEAALGELSKFIETYQIIGELHIKLIDIQEVTFKLIDNENVCSSTDSHKSTAYYTVARRASESDDFEQFVSNHLNELSDFRNIIDTAPITIELDSSISLVEYIFTRLGNRVISLTEDGEFVGIIHKKQFINSCKNRKML